MFLGRRKWTPDDEAMIVIIRDREPGDFVWVSHRLGRSLNLSARPSDNAGLEDFLMQEFFDDRR